VIIWVAGIPAPQGSKRHVGGGRMVEVSRAVGPWREAVRAETQDVMEGNPPLTGPVKAVVDFRLPRPKSAPKNVRLPAKRPDLDKLCRAVLDGITAGGAIADDSQVVVLYALKRFAEDGYPVGARISIEEVPS
jgi:crossover junction endodeoxyribonuclease RusA